MQKCELILHGEGKIWNCFEFNFDQIIIIYLFVDGKNGSNWDKAVDVWGTIQWVKAHDVFSLIDENKKKDLRINKWEKNI